MPSGKSGYVQLLMSPSNKRQEANKLIRTSVDKDNLSPKKLANKFFGELQEACSEDSEDDSSSSSSSSSEDDLRCIKDRITLHQHGPAVQMDVMDRPATATNAIKIYSVDMVPTIEISGTNGEGEHYIVQPKKKRKPNRQIAWRRSFALTEKERLVTIDRDNGCRKQVLRVLKVIRNHDGGVGQLSSYHLKTVLLRKIDELPNSAQWKSECLGQRLMDVICQLEKELDKGDMPHYFLPGVNLLDPDGMKEETVINVRNRLKKFKNSEQKMTRLLQSWKN